MTVLDASALIAFLFDEPGSDVVARSLNGATISAVNLSEVYAKFGRDGIDLPSAKIEIETLDLVVVPFDEPQAAIVAELIPTSSQVGLSFADRACIALGLLRGLPVLTADRVWADLDLGVEVQLIR